MPAACSPTVLLACLLLLPTAHGVASFRLVAPERLATNVAWWLLRARCGVRVLTVGVGVEIRDAGGGKGLGAFATEPIAQGQCVARYTGEQRTLARHDEFVERGFTSGRYAIGLGSGRVVDAEEPRRSAMLDTYAG